MVAAAETSGIPRRSPFEEIAAAALPTSCHEGAGVDVENPPPLPDQADSLAMPVTSPRRFLASVGLVPPTAITPGEIAGNSVDGPPLQDALRSPPRSPVAARSVIPSWAAVAISVAQADWSGWLAPSGVPNDIETTETPGIPVTAFVKASVIVATLGE